MMKIFSAIRRFWERFLRGPSWTKPPPVLLLPGQKVYHSSALALWSWVSVLYTRSVARPARFLILLFFVTLFYSSSILRNPIQYLCFFMAACGLCDLLIGLIFFPRVTVRRRLPKRVSCTRLFPVEYEMENRRALPCGSLTFDSNLPCRGIAAPNEEVFFTLKGKESRHAIQWFRAVRRGVYSLPRGIAETAFPLRIFQITHVYGEQETLIVHPYCRELPELTTAIGQKLQKQSSGTLPMPGESLDFFSCRDFRYGDAPGKIHWRATARHNKLTVKEFQQEHVSRAAVILDNGSGFSEGYRKPLPIVLRNLFVHSLFTHDDAVFEAAVSRCASIAHTLRRADFRIDIFAAGSEIHRFPTGRGLNAESAVLDLLAGLQTVRGDSFRELPHELMKEIASIGCVFLLLRHWNAETETLCRKLRDAGAELKIEMIAENPKKLPPEFHIGQLRPDDIFPRSERR